MIDVASAVLTQQYFAPLDDRRTESMYSKSVTWHISMSQNTSNALIFSLILFDSHQALKLLGNQSLRYPKLGWSAFASGVTASYPYVAWSTILKLLHLADFGWISLVSKLVFDRSMNATVYFLLTTPLEAGSVSSRLYIHKTDTGVGHAMSHPPSCCEFQNPAEPTYTDLCKIS